MALGCLIGVAALAALGRAWRGENRERRLRAAWCGSVFTLQGVGVIYWLAPGNFEVELSLPLHVCDVMAWIGPIALLTQRRALRALTYFWGLGLSSQAFLTPVLEEGPETFRFWLFWLGHAQIIGCAVYDLVALRYRPTGRDFLIVTIAGVVYIGAMLAINLPFGLNYGYVGRTTPEAPTLVEALGPWPWRIGVMWLIGEAFMLAMWLIWPIAGAVSRSPEGTTSAA